MEENKCVICGGPLGENTIPSETLDGDVCFERQGPDLCELLDKAHTATVRLRDSLLESMARFEAGCSLSASYYIRRNLGLRVLDCGHLPAVREAISNLQRVLDGAIANPGGPHVQE